MSRFCWVFVLVAVVVVVGPCDARPHKCQQRERSLADLDLAEDSLNRAKQLYPNCGPHIPTEEPLTPTDETLSPTEGEDILTSTEEPTREVTTEDFRPMDCQDLMAAGHVTSGVYSVWLQGGTSAVRVRCDMDTEGGGWTVIQRRGNFGKQEDFNRNWQDYKHGFGSLERDFWLGNDNIFALSNQGNYSLRMDMTAADGDSAYALFREFRIEDEKANFTLHLGEYAGTAGNSMIRFDKKMFTTKDRKNNEEDASNCAVARKGGFWHWGCDSWWDCNPNGLYNPGGIGETSMYYQGFKHNLGLSSFDMKLRRSW